MKTEPDQEQYAEHKSDQKYHSKIQQALRSTIVISYNKNNQNK